MAGVVGTGGTGVTTGGGVDAGGLMKRAVAATMAPDAAAVPRLL